jgi:hypothetical protein
MTNHLPYGPAPLRHKCVLGEAIAELTEAGRVRLLHDRQPRKIEINPALLGDQHGAA